MLEGISSQGIHQRSLAPPPPPMRTCLHENHVRAGATMVDFHGWEMPIRYGPIPAEHLHVRKSAGLFDLCHMGRLEISGPAATAWLQSVVTSDVAALEPGRARYGFVCDAAGGILDDVIAYRLAESYLLVVNAGNRVRVTAWLQERRSTLDADPEDAADTVLRDRTLELGMLAAQGPASLEIIGPLLEWIEHPLTELPYYGIVRARIDGNDALVATTGYTGERGLEIYLPATAAPAFWERVLDEGGDGIVPVGLGARDTLRIEAGMPLYGNELGIEINPYEVGLGFAVALDGSADFVGREALARVRAAGPRRKLIGLKINSRKVARTGMRLFQRDRNIGAVTSGIPSPTLGYPVAMALIERDVMDPEGIEIEIRGKRFGALPVPLPFYSHTRKQGKKAL